MRGLEEIKKINETPHGFHGDSNEREQYGNAPSAFEHGRRAGERAGDEIIDKTRPTLQKILEEITGGQPKSAVFKRNLALASLVGDMTPAEAKEMAAVATVFELLGLPMPDDYQEAKALAVVLSMQAINTLDKVLGDKPKPLPSTAALQRHLGMDGIASAIGEKPAFLAFWQKLNDDRAAGGQGEAMYREAKLVFSGGETPRGTLTFVGKEWNGLRATPAKKYEGRKTYHAEFSSIAPEGNTIWNVVSNTNSDPISYADAEAALHGARHARIHSETLKS